MRSDQFLSSSAYPIDLPALASPLFRANATGVALTAAFILEKAAAVNAAPFALSRSTAPRLRQGPNERPMRCKRINVEWDVIHRAAGSSPMTGPPGW